MKRRVCVLGFLTVLVTLPLSASERVALKVSPQASFAPAFVRVQALIEQNADNRAVEIVAQSADFFRSSTIQLEGEHAARTNVFEFKDLPEGVYEVTATVYGADGKAHASAVKPVNVVPRGH